MPSQSSSHHNTPSTPSHHRSSHPSHHHGYAHPTPSPSPTTPLYQNPPCPLTAPPTTITLPPRLTRLYIPLLSLPPSSPLHKKLLSTLPRPLLKPAYRKPSLLTRIARSFSHRNPRDPVAREKEGGEERKEGRCDLCPLHICLEEEPLIHLMGLMSYELHTHLQALRAMHPSSRSPITNQILETLHHWHENRYLEPGLRVKGCVACCLGYFLGDRESVRALGVLARSARKVGRGDGALVREGWWDGVPQGERRVVGAVMEDRRRWRGRRVGTRMWAGRVGADGVQKEKGYTEPRTTGSVKRREGEGRERRRSAVLLEKMGKFKGDSLFTNLDDLAYARGEHVRRQGSKTRTESHANRASRKEEDGDEKKRDSGATTLLGSPISRHGTKTSKVSRSSTPMGKERQHHEGKRPSWVRSDVSASVPPPLIVNHQRQQQQQQQQRQLSQQSNRKATTARRESISFNPSQPPHREPSAEKQKEQEEWNFQDELPEMSTYNHEFSEEDAAFEDVPLVVPSVLPVEADEQEEGEFDFDQLDDNEDLYAVSNEGKAEGDGAKRPGGGEVSEGTRKRYVKEHVSLLRRWEEPRRPVVPPASSFYSRPVE